MFNLFLHRHLKVPILVEELRDVLLAGPFEELEIHSYNKDRT